MGADLDFSVEGVELLQHAVLIPTGGDAAGDGIGPGEAHPSPRHFHNVQSVFRTHHDFSGFWANIQHIAGLAIGGGVANLEAFSLPDGVAVGAGVVANDLPVPVDNGSGLRA